jgi:hypothetical protein
VVVTARGLGKSLPSLWQQHVRNGNTLSFSSYLRQLASQRQRFADGLETDIGQHLWRAFALGRLAKRWASVVGRDRVHVVVAGDGPPQLLWSRFAQAIGYPQLAAVFEEGVLGTRAHTGLTAPEAELLVALNCVLDDRYEWAGYLRQQITTGALVPRADRGPPIRIPGDWQEQVSRWSRDDIGELLATNVTVTGDIDDLRYRPEPLPPQDQLTGHIAAAAGAAIAALWAGFEPTLQRRLTTRLRRTLVTSRRAARPIVTRWPAR